MGGSTHTKWWGIRDVNKGVGVVREAKGRVA